MRGLLAEIRENLEIAAPAGEVPFRLPFVRDAWVAAKERVGDLPDEVAESVRRAYALAAKSDRLLEWQIILSDRGADIAERVAATGAGIAKQAEEALVAAGTVLEHWIRMKEETEDTEAREGPSL